MQRLDGAFAVLCQAGGQFCQLRPRAIHQSDAGAILQGTLAGQGRTCATASAHDEHAELLQRAPAAFLDSAGEAGTIGVVPMPAIFLANQGVHSAAELCKRVELHCSIMRFLLERYRHIDTDETELR